MVFLLLTVLMWNSSKDAYGNPYTMYVNRASVVSATSHVGHVCEDWAFEKCSKNVEEVCQLVLINRESVIVKGSCKEAITKIKRKI
jgi:hypothetical protein